MPTMLIDSHAHLDDPRFAPDLDATLARAREAGVGGILTVGAGLESSVAAVALAQKHPHLLRAAVGIHPHEADRVTDDARSKIETLAASPDVVAVGETGLDYHYDNSSRQGQRAAFEWQLDLAARCARPVIIHCREAYDDTLAILAAHASRCPLRGVAHCFSGDWTQARRFLDLGLCLSFAGTLTFPKAVNLRDVAARVPLDRLLVETDCPYLAPQPTRGRRNEPAFILHTVSLLESLRPSDRLVLRDALASNTARLFGLSPTI